MIRAVSQPPCRLPPALPPGGRIGVVALASPVRPERLEQGMAPLRELGFELALGAHALDREGHHAGAPADRAADLMEMFARPDIDAIFCTRGGSSSIRVLEHLDFDLIRAHPKPFVGYSDITSIQLVMMARTGLPAFFGPMVTPDWADGVTPAARDLLWRLLCHAEPAGPIRDPLQPGRAWPLVAGCVKGVLTGGTLSLVAATLGTPEQIELTGRIFCFEDIHESPARIERYLAQLARAGVLGQASGFVVGPLRWDATEEERSTYLPFEMVLRQQLVPLARPTVVGYPFGHVPSPLTLPLGIMAELDADRGVLRVLEPAVR